MSRLPEPLAAYLDPTTIEVYLLAHDWEAVKRNKTFSVWRPGKSARNAGEFLFVPLLSTPADFEDRLRDVVARLSEMEERDPETMATNLRYATADLIRISLVSPRVGLGELPIEDGRNLFDGAKDMMRAAACAAIDPRPSFGTRTPETAKDYLEGVRLGQTERGSYVVTVISHVAAPEQQALVPDDVEHVDVPFERRVTTRLMESLEAAQAAARDVLASQGTVAETFEEAVPRGVSSNLCAAITKMSEQQTAARVHISMDWASSRAPIQQAPPSVTFEPSSMPVISEAVDLLRNLGPFDDELVEGFVVRLNRGKEEEAIGSIAIEGVVRGARRIVHVELPDEQYHLALRAHDDRRPVRVRGTLAKRGRNWVLSDPGQLRFEDE